MLSSEYVCCWTQDSISLSNSLKSLRTKVSVRCARPNLTLHGRGPGITRGCNVPGGLQEKSLESAPLVNPCSNLAQQVAIEVLEGGYGHNIGLCCVPGVPPRPSHGGTRELRDGTVEQKSDLLELCL